jgi:peptidyl-prolyl cis-trans isomerase D
MPQRATRPNGIAEAARAAPLLAYAWENVTNESFMIKIIHRHNKIVTYVFLFMAACFMLSGVGLDILHDGPTQKDYAIKVNDEKISPMEFERARENMTQRYRQMFGDNFEALAKSFNLDLTQQTIDNLVDSTLLNQEATEWGFSGNDEAVKKYIANRIFAGREVSSDAVRGMLQSLGINGRQFSAQIKKELGREALVNTLRDVSFVSKSEIQSRYTQQETKYAVIAASLAQDEYLTKTSEPSEEDLKKLYDQTATQYDLPARVTYEYLVFQPSDYEKSVQILPQDLELFYTENRVRSIKLLYPKENDPTKMASVKEKAKQAHEEALSGKPFAELVVKYSDDLPAKLSGGDRGWLPRGSGSKAFEKAVFKAAPGTIAELIDEDWGFEIAKVEEKKGSTPKPFDTVKDEIENAMRAQEAPSYAAAKAREVVEQTKKTSTSVADVAKSMGLPVPKSSVLSQTGQDPDPLLKGLTQQALLIPPSERLIATVVDLGESTVALQIRDFKEPTTPAFEEVKEKVRQAWKKDQATKLLDAKAQELIAQASKDPGSFATLAKTMSATVTNQFEISPAAPTSSTLATMTPEMREAIFSSRAAPRVLGKPYRGANGLVVGAVVKVTEPDTKSTVASEVLDKYRREAGEQSTQQAIASSITILKTQAKLDVASDLLVR